MVEKFLSLLLLIGYFRIFPRASSDILFHILEVLSHENHRNIRRLDIFRLVHFLLPSFDNHHRNPYRRGYFFDALLHRFHLT